MHLLLKTGYLSPTSVDLKDVHLKPGSFERSQAWRAKRDEATIRHDGKIAAPIEARTQCQEPPASTCHVRKMTLCPEAVSMLENDQVWSPMGPDF